MALQKVYSKEVFGQPMSFNQAYIQITHLSGAKDSINLDVTVFDNSGKQNTVDRLNYFFVPDVTDAAKNFYKQGYEYLKSLSEFSGAVDVLENGQTT